MALLKLENVGKIYVSEGNVSVGIRGVDLSFERGEFVAVTGQSGSGKSTLLNVISGMDTYEEGEMYVEGQPTSHYMQPDWEEYRKKYISFIFQDYNIIDSFTVLQNVELALMHIEDKKERRRRAMELIGRVGLTSHVKQKGSKLSGGQKQRTVIARALAKDSPIILADEPTGNLDSATSAEIIELLREVSRDKLLIVVTHNFEQVEAYATRHVRVFDGAIESDRPTGNAGASDAQREAAQPIKAKDTKRSQLRNGIVLGRSIFTSRPKLSLFLSVLMIVGAMGIFFVTSLCGDAANMFEKNYMFSHIDGRVVLTRQDGAVMDDAEVEALAEEYGADEALKYDILLDSTDSVHFYVEGMERYQYFDCTYGEDFGDGIIGEYPEKENEVLLYVPISYKKHIGESASSLGSIWMDSLELKVSGVKYYVDNNITPKCLFTREGFRTATAVYYLLNNNGSNLHVNIYSNDGGIQKDFNFHRFKPSYEVEDGKIYVNDPTVKKYVDMKDVNYNINFNAYYYNYDYVHVSGINGGQMNFSRSLKAEDITAKGPTDMTVPNPHGMRSEYEMAMSPYLMRDIAEDVLTRSYKQVSLFYENDAEAAEAAERLRDGGYIAVTSDTTYTPDAITYMMTVIESVLYIVIWLLAIAFLAFFINLCSSRTIGAFKGDMAIMRSMGIPVKAIRIGMYVRMLIALIPAYVLVVAAAVLVYTTPAFNAFFTYLYVWQYVLIFVGMLLLTVRITQKQIKKLFGQSVKKALRGGAAND